MNNNGPPPSFIDLFTGNDKYISGLLIILANVIGFMNHFRKANYTVYQTYSILIILIIIGSLLARI